MQKPTLRRLPLLIAAAFASGWIYAADAAQSAEQVQLEEVVVTGERTNRSGFETAFTLKPADYGANIEVAPEVAIKVSGEGIQAK